MNIVERPETLCNQFDRHGNDFDAKENIVSYNSFGKTKTFFKPRSKNYWKNQSKKWWKAMEDMKEKESFIRKIYNQNYVAIANFSRAKETKNAFVIFEGDDGGTIYLTCPMNLIKCSEKKLQKLLEYIDRLYWNDIESANIFYEVIEPNQPIAGGMDGGYVTDSIWIHPEIIKLGLEEKICETIYNN